MTLDPITVLLGGLAVAALASGFTHWASRQKMTPLEKMLRDDAFDVADKAVAAAFDNSGSQATIAAETERMAERDRQRAKLIAKLSGNGPAA